MNDDDEYEALIPDYMRPVGGAVRTGQGPGKTKSSSIVDAAKAVDAKRTVERVMEQIARDQEYARQQKAIKALEEISKQAASKQPENTIYEPFEGSWPKGQDEATPEPIDITDPELSEAAIGRFYQSIVLPEFCNCTRCRKSFASKDAAVVVTPLYKITEGDTVSYTREIEVVCPTCWDVMNASVEKKPSPLEASEWDILD